MNPGARDRTAVVTGIAGEIGGSIGHVLRASGYRVIGIDRCELSRAETCDIFLTADLGRVGRSEAVAGDLAKAVVDAIGEESLNLLVNNAAVQHLAPIHDLAWTAWEETLAVNVSAPFALSQLLLPSLRAVRGVIVNIGSVHAVATKPSFVAYTTSKAALHGLTRALAVDLGPDVRVVTVAPAAVETRMLADGFTNEPKKRALLDSVHPLGRVASPDEVAQAVLFVASAGAAFMTGSEFWLDGGVLSRLHDPM